MKLEWILLGLLLAMWVVLAATLAHYERGMSHDAEHGQFHTMNQGGSGIQRHGQLLVLGWLFGAISIALFTGAVALGARRGRRLGGATWTIVVSGTVYIAVYSLMMWSYREYLHHADPSYLGPFPTPTSWMLFGLWAAPLSFVGLYVWNFDRWIFSAEDLDRFQQLVASRRGEGDG